MQCEKDGWYGIEWQVLWDARNETIDLRLDNKLGINKEKFKAFVSSGNIDRLDWMFDDEQEISIGLEAFA
jgi:hypothetical protein